MRIAYVANHDAGGNEDEAAIAHALERLGHEVFRLQECQGRRLVGGPRWDLLLFHKWHDLDAVRKVRASAKAFWWFDLVDFPGDPTIAARCAQRRRWMEEVTPLVDLGFLSDGDWVAADRTGKLLWLPQGADGRKVGRGDPARAASCLVCRGAWSHPKILFTGISRGGGQGRVSFVEWASHRWGSQFRHVPQGLYGRDLADAVAASEVVICPDSPVTDRYWSNRVWNALGFGAFVIHPWCERLGEMFKDREELVYYRTREELAKLVEAYTERTDQARWERQRISAAGLGEVCRKHLYEHRCVELLSKVQRFMP